MDQRKAVITGSTAISGDISMGLLVSCPQGPQGDVMSRDGGYAHSGCTAAEGPKAWYLL